MSSAARPQHHNGRDGPSGKRFAGHPLSSGGLWMAIILCAGFIQILSLTFHNCAEVPPTNNRDNRPLPAQTHPSSDRQPARPLSNYWWPSLESGGFLSAIHNAQHAEDCSAKSTKYLVMRSLKKNDGDNRGLSSWATVTMLHMLHAFTDGDKFESGGRILINDEKLWPMAKGCKHGPETRECYFLPLTNCKLSDVDPMDHKSAIVLAGSKDKYDRSARTVYSSLQKYPRMSDEKTEWSGLPGPASDHSQTSLTAAFLAYNLQPKPWLQKEIDSRLRRSMPSDIDPQRTVGVPIRRSDKCFGHEVSGSAGGELDCPPLEEYLAAVKTFTRFDPLINSVIVTSEDPTVCPEFISLLNKELPNLRVIVNVGDVQQGTGSASKLEAYKDAVNNAEVIASALTSFHMHIRARYFVITTKSIWTASIAIFARVYGFATDVYVIDIGRNRNGYSDMARSG